MKGRGALAFPLAAMGRLGPVARSKDATAAPHGCHRMEQTDRTWYTTAFADGVDVGAYCPTSAHEHALGAVRSWLGERSRLMLLIGAPGAGKSMLARLLLARHASPERSALVTIRPGGPSIVSALAASLGLTASIPADAVGPATTLAPLVIDVRKRLRRYRDFLVIVDQAEHLDSVEHTALAALLEGRQSGVRALLIGRPSAQAVFHPHANALRSVLGRVMALEPLSASDTAAYVRHRLAWAGATRADLDFDDGACARAHVSTGGNPRSIHLLCDAAVRRAVQRAERRVTAETLAEAWETIMETTGAGAADREAVLSEAVVPREEVEATPTGAPGSLSASVSDAVNGGRGPRAVDSDAAIHATLDEASASSEGFDVVSEASVDHLIANGEALLARLEESLEATNLQTVESAVSASGETAERDLSVRLRKAERVIEKLGAVTARAVKRAALAEDKAARAANVYQNTARLMVARVENADSISRQIAGQIQRIEELGRESSETERRLTALLQRADQCGLETRQRTEHAERELAGAEHRATDAIGNIETAAARVSAVETKLEELLNQARADRVETVKLSEQLGDQAPHLEQLKRTLSSLGGSVTILCDKASAAATELTGLLTESRTRDEEARRTVQTLEQRVATSRIELDRALAPCVEIEKRLGEHRARLEELIAVAERTAMTLRDQAGDITRQFEQDARLAEQRCGALGSHIAAATQAVNELSRGGLDARRAIAEVDESRGRAAEVLASLAEALHEAQAKADAAAASGQSLEQGRQQAEPVLHRLESAVGQARELTSALNDGNALARQSAETLRGSGTSATKLIERLSAVSVSLQSAQALHDRLTTAIGEARTVSDGQRHLQEQGSAVAERLDQAARHGAQVAADVDGAETRCQEKLVQLRDEIHQAEAIVGRADELLHRIDDAEGAVEVGDKMLREFLTQAQTLSTMLKDLHVKSADLERQVQELSRDPQALVQDARRQTEQLDKVCRAVQKVFSGLSRISLEANKKIEELKTLDQQTDERLTRLSSETEEAARTLKEWVEEAIRAQARLAATIAKTPGIAQTHTLHPLQLLARSLEEESPKTTARSTASTSRKSVVPPSSASSTNNARSAPHGRQKSRTQQITELIREAQKSDVAAPVAGTTG